MVITNYVVAETYTLLRYRRGAFVSLEFLRRIKATPTIHKVLVPEAWEEEAEELLARYRDQAFSYVDATSFVVMRKLGLREVLTFDADFSVGGFTVLS